MSDPDERTLAALADAGVPVEEFSPEERVVLGTLSPEELALLIDIKARLDAAAPEVQLHSNVAGGALF